MVILENVPHNIIRSPYYMYDFLLILSCLLWFSAVYNLKQQYHMLSTIDGNIYSKLNTGASNTVCDKLSINAGRTPSI